MNSCRRTTTQFCHNLRIAAFALCSMLVVPPAHAFSDGKSGNTTVEFEVVIPRFIGLTVGTDGRLAVTSNSGEVAVISVRSATARRRRFAEASDPPDYSSEIDIQTFDVDPDFRSNPTLIEGRRLALLGDANAQPITVRSRSGRGTTALSSPDRGSTTVTAP